MDTVPYAIHCDKTHEPFTTTDVIIQRGWVHFENVGDGLHRHLVRIDCSSRFEDLFAINSRRTPLWALRLIFIEERRILICLQITHDLYSLDS